MNSVLKENCKYERGQYIKKEIFTILAILQCMIGFKTKKRAQVDFVNLFWKINIEAITEQTATFIQETLDFLLQ